MSLNSHGIRHVYFAGTYLVAGNVGVDVGLGMTSSGYLTAFSYSGATDVMVAQLIWPIQIEADVSHQVGVTIGDGYLRMYVDGVAHPSPAALTTVPGGAYAAVGGLWTGYDSEHTGLNAHWVSLGQWSYWNRTLTAQDMMAIYMAGQPWTSYEVSRVSKVLNFAGWPALRRDGLSFPHSTYELLASPKWEVGATALELIQRAISSVDGVIFVAADGRLTYQRPTDRHVLANPTLIFSEGDGTSIEGDFAYTIDDNDLINTISATARSGLVFQRTDPESIALYDEKAATIDCDLAYPGDVVARAVRTLNRSKSPILRAPTLTVDLTATPDATMACIDVELGDVIGLAGLPPTAPDPSMTVVVESIAWSISAESGDWQVTFEVSPGSMYRHTQLDFPLDNNSLGG